MTSTIQAPKPQGIRGESFKARAARYRLRCLDYAKYLKNDLDPDTVHELRVNLRRVQSYAEFLEHMEAAERLGCAVSWFSHLRALNELHRYLLRNDAAAKDIRRVEKEVRKEKKDIGKAGRLKMLISLLGRITPESLARPPEFVRNRLERLHVENRAVMDSELQKLSSKPTRKELHRLRLLIKSLRYRQEIAVEMHWGNPQTVKALKRLQHVLGEYTDLAQFTRLAEQLHLRCRDKIKKDRRRYLKHARRAVLRLKSQHALPLLRLKAASHP
ncbi:MAG TPA: CHAD domain-containing protein [Nitrospirales bacterium]